MNNIFDMGIGLFNIVWFYWFIDFLFDFLIILMLNSNNFKKKYSGGMIRDVCGNFIVVIGVYFSYLLFVDFYLILIFVDLLGIYLIC